MNQGTLLTGVNSYAGCFDTMIRNGLKDFAYMAMFVPLQTTGVKKFMAVHNVHPPSIRMLSILDDLIMDYPRDEIYYVEFVEMVTAAVNRYASMASIHEKGKGTLIVESLSPETDTYRMFFNPLEFPADMIDYDNPEVPSYIKKDESYNVEDFFGSPLTATMTARNPESRADILLSVRLVIDSARSYWPTRN